MRLLPPTFCSNWWAAFSPPSGQPLGTLFAVLLFCTLSSDQVPRSAHRDGKPFRNCRDVAQKEFALPMSPMYACS
jgi:hypothetical protein